MGLVDNFLGRFGYTKAPPQYHEWLRAAARSEGTQHIDPARWENQADLYRRLSWVNIAVSIIARSAAITAFSVKEMLGEKTKDIVNHDFERLLYRPNPLMSRFELLESTVAYRSLTGNSYWWLNKPSENEPPIEMWVIPSHKIEPVPDERMFLKGYLFDPGLGQKIPMEVWEIVHFKAYNPLSMFVGLSPIEAFATVAVGDIKMQDWNTRLFAENNARLPGILAFADPINQSEWEQIKKDSVEQAKKRQLMMLRNVGKGGVEWLQNTMSQKDMEFLAGREFNKEEIFGIYAPGLASMLDVNATEANAKTGRATFNEYCLWPILVSMAEKITNNLLPYYGDDLRGEFDDIRFVDRALKVREQMEFNKTHTIDEIRTEYYDEKGLGDPRGKLLPTQILGAPVPPEFMYEDEESMAEKPEKKPMPPQLQQTQEENGKVPEAEEEPDTETELKAWRNFAKARLGKNGRPFKCNHIPVDLQERIRSGLLDCTTEDDVDRVFNSLKVIKSEFYPLLEKIDEGMRTLLEVEA